MWKITKKALINVYDKIFIPINNKLNFYYNQL